MYRATLGLIRADRPLDHRLDDTVHPNEPRSGSGADKKPVSVGSRGVPILQAGRRKRRVGAVRIVRRRRVEVETDADGLFTGSTAATRLIRMDGIVQTTIKGTVGADQT